MATKYSILWNSMGQAALTDTERSHAESLAQLGELPLNDTVESVYLSGAGGRLYTDDASPPNLWVMGDRVLLVGAAVVDTTEQIPGEGDFIPQSKTFADFFLKAPKGN
jgi:ethanolamine utilization protein EutA (predicted chaperonin)